MFTIPVPGSKSSLLMTLPTASCGLLKPSLRRRIGVQHHVDAALGERDFLGLVDGEAQRHVVGRAVRIEPASGDELQAHGIEIARAHIILSDVHLLVASRRDEPGIVAVVGRNSNVRQTDCDDARNALHLLLDHLRLG